MLDRRHTMALDEVFQYWRELEVGEQPRIFKVTDSIRTIDLAMEPDWRERSPGPLVVTPEPWSRIRDNLYQVLITKFAGYFIILDTESNPIVPGTYWPTSGRVEFFPEGINRKSDSFECQFERIHPEILIRIRWHFGRGEQSIRPNMFDDVLEKISTSAEDEVCRVLERFYEICEQEAVKGKRKAKQHWWHLYCESQSIENGREQRELRKQLVYLEAVWGCGDPMETAKTS